MLSRSTWRSVRAAAYALMLALGTKKVLICDLCDGDPQCARVCQEGGWNCLRVVEREDREFKLYARVPDETAKILAIKLYGEKAEEFI